MQTKVEDSQEQPTLGQFDFGKTVEFDKISKRVIRRNPYRLYAVDGVNYVEHPVGSGNLWWENKQPAGRIDAGVIKKGAAHVAWNPPPTQDEELATRVAKAEQENARLVRELAEIKKEQAAAAKPVEVKQGAKNV